MLEKQIDMHASAGSHNIRSAAADLNIASQIVLAVRDADASAETRCPYLEELKLFSRALCQQTKR